MRTYLKIRLCRNYKGYVPESYARISLILRSTVCGRVSDTVTLQEFYQGMWRRCVWCCFSTGPTWQHGRIYGFGAKGSTGVTLGSIEIYWNLPPYRNNTRICTRGYTVARLKLLSNRDCMRARRITCRHPGVCFKLRVYRKLQGHIRT